MRSLCPAKTFVCVLGTVFIVMNTLVRTSVQFCFSFADLSSGVILPALSGNRSNFQTVLRLFSDIELNSAKYKRKRKTALK